MFKKQSATINYNSEKVFLASTQPREIAYNYFETTRYGLTDEEVAERQKRYGDNEIAREKKNHGIVLFIRTFMNPFIGILMVLALVSFMVDVLLEKPEDRNRTTVIVISTMVFLSSVLRFVQEMRSAKASEALQRMVKNTASVFRNGNRSSEEVNITELVPGDVVYLSAGDMVPADIRIVESKDLFVSQSSLTGESEPAADSLYAYHGAFCLSD